MQVLGIEGAPVDTSTGELPADRYRIAMNATKIHGYFTIFVTHLDGSPGIDPFRSSCRFP